MFRTVDILANAAKNRFVNIPLAGRGTYRARDAHLLESPVFEQGIREGRISEMRAEARNVGELNGNIANQIARTNPINMQANMMMRNAQRDFDINMRNLHEQREFLENRYIQNRVEEINPIRENRGLNLGEIGQNNGQRPTGNLQTHTEPKIEYETIEQKLSQFPHLEEYYASMMKNMNLNLQSLVPKTRIEGASRVIPKAQPKTNTVQIENVSKETNPQNIKPGNIIPKKDDVTSIALRGKTDVMVPKTNGQTAVIEIGSKPNLPATIGKQKVELQKYEQSKAPTVYSKGETNVMKLQAEEKSLTNEQKLMNSLNIMGFQETGMTVPKIEQKAIVNPTKEQKGVTNPVKEQKGVVVQPNLQNALNIFGNEEKGVSVTGPKQTDIIAKKDLQTAVVKTIDEQKALTKTPETGLALYDASLADFKKGKPFISAYGKPVNIDKIVEESRLKAVGVQNDILRDYPGLENTDLDKIKKPPMSALNKGRYDFMKYPVGSPMFMLLYQSSLRYGKAMRDLQGSSSSSELSGSEKSDLSDFDREQVLNDIGIPSKLNKEINEKVANEALRYSIDTQSTIKNPNDLLFNYGFLGYNSFLLNPVLHPTKDNGNVRALDPLNEGTPAEVEALLTRNIHKGPELMGYMNYLDMVQDPQAMKKTELVMDMGLKVDPRTVRASPKNNAPISPKFLPFVGLDFAFARHVGDTSFYDKLPSLSEHFRGTGLDRITHAIEDLRKEYRFFKRVYYITRPIIKYIYNRFMHRGVNMWIDEDNYFNMQFPEKENIIQIKIVEDERSDEKEVNAIMEDDEYSTIIDMVYYNLILDVESLCVEKFDIEDCEKAVQILIDVGSKLGGGERRDYSLVGRLIENGFTTPKMKEILAFIKEQETFDSFLKKAQIYRDRFEFLLYQYISA